METGAVLHEEVYYAMASRVFPLRASEAERVLWQAAADGAGLSFNAWARRALNEQEELQAAELVEVLPDPRVKLWSINDAVLDLGGKFKPDPRR